jgi:alpha,alpha-trehalose phosphorylase
MLRTPDVGRTLEVHPWEIREREVKPDTNQKHETIFALGNGYMGLRGTFGEGIRFPGDPPPNHGHGPHSTRGAYVNGVYDYYDYVYNWRRTAYPEHGHSILNVADYNLAAITVAGEPFSMTAGAVADYLRTLDMRRGTLTRELTWTSPGGNTVRITVEKLLSMDRPHVAAIRITITPLSFSGPIEVASSLDGDVANRGNPGQVLQVTATGERDGIGHLAHRTSRSGFALAYAMAHRAAPEAVITASASERRVEARVAFDAEQGSTYVLDKFVAVYTSREAPAESLVEQAVAEAQAAAEAGFDALRQAQEAYWAGFWEDADLEIEGDVAAQQGVRFALFQLAQSCGRDGRTSCGANGLTGEAYSGHVFWDSEMYVLPAFLYSRPEIARSLLGYRHHILDRARERARQMEDAGALFSWNSISGEECGYVFEAATAQYHINNDIAYAIAKYIEATDDEEFLAGAGAEILFETARCMAHRGAFIPLRGGAFCINVVCGPDEYTPAVDNNLYTNMLTQHHLRCALQVANWMRRERPDQYRALVERLGLDDDEFDLWQRAADKMYLPYHEKLGVNPQDDAFLYRDPVDVAKLSQRGYILMNMHPLNIWRLQVAKQADVVLLMLLMPDRFSPELKRRNFDFYEPRTIHDSSLSPAIHSILANEIGYHDRAYDYFTRTARMDLDDVKGNAAGGVHAACMGGSWMAIVYGFGGLRVYDDRLHFRPYLPPAWTGYRFKVLFRGSRIGVAVAGDGASFRLLEGEGLDLEVNGETVELNGGRREVTAPLSA